MKAVKILFVALFLMASSSVFAQQKFGVVNSQELMKSMPELDSVKTKLQKIEQSLMDDMAANEKEYTTKVQEYTKNKDSYSETIRAQKEKEINSILQRIQEFEQVANTELTNKQTEFMAPIQKKVIDAIKAVGKENEFVFIFDVTAPLYVSETMVTDATGLVKKKLGLK